MTLGQMIAFAVVIFAIGLAVIAPPVPIVVLVLIAATALALILHGYSWRGIRVT